MQYFNMSPKLPSRVFKTAWFTKASRKARIGDLLDVKLGVVDIVARTWPILETKNQRRHTIHLSALAIRQFERLAEFREAIPQDLNRAVAWVFPNASATVPVGVKSFGK